MITEQNVMSLDDAFASRPARFKMLEKGLGITKWADSNLFLLEVGCANGDAAAHLSKLTQQSIIGVDASAERIHQANKTYTTSQHEGKLQYLCARAENLPFADSTFDGLFCEAAFSPFHNKEAVLSEYGRVLKSGSKILFNDFAIHNSCAQELRKVVAHIPCFAGVQTVECYIEMFSKHGFRLVYKKEAFDELVRISSWLCKVYNVTIKDIGKYLSNYLGQDQTLLSEPAEQNFFNTTRLTYCQIVFEKI